MQKARTKTVVQATVRVPDAGEVAKLIRKYIERESWDHPNSSIDVFEGRIIMTNRRRTLDAAEEFLREMKVWYTH